MPPSPSPTRSRAISGSAENSQRKKSKKEGDHETPMLGATEAVAGEPEPEPSASSGKSKEKKGNDSKTGKNKGKGKGSADDKGIVTAPATASPASAQALEAAVFDVLLVKYTEALKEKGFQYLEAVKAKGKGHGFGPPHLWLFEEMIKIMATEPKLPETTRKYLNDLSEIYCLELKERSENSQEQQKLRLCIPDPRARQALLVALARRFTDHKMGKAQPHLELVKGLELAIEQFLQQQQK
jgi:hypothetical protein